MSVPCACYCGSHVLRYLFRLEHDIDPPNAKMSRTVGGRTGSMQMRHEEGSNSGFPSCVGAAKSLHVKFWIPIVFP